MHYALPQRKSSSRPPVFSSRSSHNGTTFQPKRLRPQVAIIIALGGFTVLYLLYRLFGHSSPTSHLTSASLYRSSSIVLVTCFRDAEDESIMKDIIRNRETYAAKHGYKTFFPLASNYSIAPAPLSWAKIPALRHAMATHPTAHMFFYLDPHVLIANPDISVSSHFLSPARLEALMVTDVPIVPPDSVIRTFAGLQGTGVDFVLTQDREGLSEKSFVVRQGDWAKFLLDAWFDPLYRSYNFQKAEKHALEHLVQWHGTILAKLALVPQNTINSYHSSHAKSAQDNGVYKEGDFIVNFGDCGTACGSLMRDFLSKKS